MRPALPGRCVRVLKHAHSALWGGGQGSGALTEKALHRAQREMRRHYVLALVHPGSSVQNPIKVVEDVELGTAQVALALSPRQLVSTLLDCRTVGLEHVPHAKEAALLVLKGDYVKFRRQYNKFQRRRRSRWWWWW